MAEFLNGVEQGTNGGDRSGGGLASIADVTVSGGAVTTLSATGLTIETGKVYNLIIYAVSAKASNNLEIAFNGFTSPVKASLSTSAGSAGSFQGTSSAIAVSMGSGGIVFCRGEFIFDGTYAHFTSQVGNYSATNRHFSQYVRQTGTSLTQIDIASSLASGLDDGTRILITEAY